MKQKWLQRNRYSMNTDLDQIKQKLKKETSRFQAKWNKP